MENQITEGSKTLNLISCHSIVSNLCTMYFESKTVSSAFFHFKDTVIKWCDAGFIENYKVESFIY